MLADRRMCIRFIKGRQSLLSFSASACTRNYASIREKRNICRSFRNYAVPSVILFSFDISEESSVVHPRGGNVNDRDTWNTVKPTERNRECGMLLESFERNFISNVCDRNFVNLQ